MISPQTIELSRAFLEEWEAKYNEACDSTTAKMTQTSQSKKGKGRKAQSNYEDPSSGAKEDIVEAGMKVPNLALDACGASFVAVDGDRIKASTKYFEDTGLMAVLCHHDRPLFLANLWTAGEKHFYALALIAAVFSHLPPHWHISIAMIFHVSFTIV